MIVAFFFFPFLLPLERKLLCLNRLMRVFFLPGLPTKLPDDVTVRAVAPQNVLVRHESLESDGPARVDPAGADPHLGAEPIAESVRKARARVDEHARRVDAAHERAAGLGRLGDDTVGVVRAVLVDVRDGGREGGHGAHGEREREVLGRVGFGWGGEHVRREVQLEVIGMRRCFWGRER